MILEYENRAYSPAIASNFWSTTCRRRGRSPSRRVPGRSREAARPAADGRGPRRRAQDYRADDATIRCQSSATATDTAAFRSMPLALARSWSLRSMMGVKRIVRWVRSSSRAGARRVSRAPLASIRCLPGAGERGAEGASNFTPAPTREVRSGTRDASGTGAGRALGWASWIGAGCLADVPLVSTRGLSGAREGCTKGASARAVDPGGGDACSAARGACGGGARALESRSATTAGAAAPSGPRVGSASRCGWSASSPRARSSRALSDDTPSGACAPAYGLAS